MRTKVLKILFTTRALFTEFGQLSQRHHADDEVLAQHLAKAVSKVNKGRVDDKWRGEGRGRWITEHAWEARTTGRCEVQEEGEECVGITGGD